MSTYSEDYCLNHDIDCFLEYKGRKIHIASNGGIFPKFIDAELNYKIQRLVYDKLTKDGISLDDIRVDEERIKKILSNDGYDHITQRDIDDYSSSFKEFAALGFDSYDYIDDKLVLLAARKSEADGGNGNVNENVFINTLPIPVVPFNEKDNDELCVIMCQYDKAA